MSALRRTAAVQRSNGEHVDRTTAKRVISPRMESVTVFADGGIRGQNPGGFGYGSFVVPRHDGVYAQRERLRFGHEWEGFRMTSIAAECLACIHAVEWLARRLPQSTRVVVMCDCRWVVGHLSSNSGKSKKDHLRRLHTRWSSAKAYFASVSVNWHSRINSVAHLGH